MKDPNGSKVTPAYFEAKIQVFTFKWPLDTDEVKATKK
jgi:hypothetical protein